MPIYEYICKDCDRLFEKLVYRPTPAGDICCPQCGTRDVEQQVSTFAVSGTVKKVSGGAGCGTCRSPNCGSCHSH